MTKEELLDMRDLVSTTVRDLILITVDCEREYIVVRVFGKRIKLYAEELWDRRNSAAKFVGYLKEKLNG